MSSKEFKLPDLGEGVHEGRVLRVMVKPGEQVREDQPLMEVETDKAAVVIPCPHTGIVETVHVNDGQLVHVGEVMVTFGSSSPGAKTASEGTAEETRHGVHTKGDTSREGSSSHAAGAVVREGSSIAGTTATLTRKPASPYVRKLARSLNLDLEAIEGTGPGGRVRQQDLEAAAALRASTNGGRGAAGTQPAASRSMTPVQPREQQTALIEATRPSRKISAIAQPVRQTIARAPVEPEGVEDHDAYGPIRRAPLSQARKTIATVMKQSMATIPHVTDTDDADITDLETLRRGYESPFENSAKLTVLAFVMRAVVRALERFPEFNAHFDEAREEVVYKRYINLAIGVHTERGLVPMVIRDADRMSIPMLNEALASLAEMARTASFTVNDTRGGTYTISNAGAMGGSRYSTPIITPGQCAVLAVGRAKWMPWVVNQGTGREQVVPRLILPLSHSIDHRLLDGGTEIAFLRHVIADLENPARLLL